MSDIPTKTYPPSFLRAMIADHEAEQAEATPEASSAAETKGDAMSDIERFHLSGISHTPFMHGEWVHYHDHLAYVERLTAERDEAMAERDAAQRERERLQDLLTCERQELSTLRDRLRVLQTNPSASLTSSRLTDEDIQSESLMRQLHYWWQEAVKLREEAETDRVVADGNKALAEVERLTGERDAALAEVQRLTAERDTAQAEVELLTRAREALRDSLREALIERNDARYEAGQLRREQKRQRYLGVQL
jgi:hypothetical protein